MKLLLLLGGVVGFGIGLSFSHAQENSWTFCLWQASLAALAGGWLLGWWGRAWQKNLKDAALEREKVAAQATSAPSIPKPIKS
jgi:hypothetical protein